MSDTIPLVDYLVLEPEPHLVANECTNCGARFFDRRNACASCFGTEFARVEVATEGEVRAFTIVAFAAPGVPRQRLHRPRHAAFPHAAVSVLMTARPRALMLISRLIHCVVLPHPGWTAPETNSGRMSCRIIRCESEFSRGTSAPCRPIHLCHPTQFRRADRGTGQGRSP